MKLAILPAIFVLMVAPVPAAERSGNVFLVDSDHHPHTRISWPCRDATTTALEADRGYAAPNDRTPVGKNLSCYVGLGGNRGDFGLGRPNAVDVRVGFYKIDKSKPMFDNLADASAITVVFSGLKFTEPARALPGTMIQHLKFEDPNNVLGCAGDPELLVTWNTYDPDEGMGGRLNRRNGRKGVLGPANSTGARVTFETDKDGLVTMTAVIPYALFKHADDAWLRSEPGDFIEPVHFHIEFEVVPLGAPDDPRPS